jgi:hypothetical protein
METISKKLYLYFWLIVLLTWQLACTPESCMQETQSYARVTFYENGTGKIKAPDTLTVYGIGLENKLIYNKTLNATSALLPLDASVENCDFVFIINGLKDTVIINYSSYPHFISKECGFTFFHKLESVYSSQNKIDTISIKNNSVIIPNEDNIKIFH